MKDTPPILLIVVLFLAAIQLLCAGAAIGMLIERQTRPEPIHIAPQTEVIYV